MSGHRVPPPAETHFYSATKYAVTALTEGLRQELREAQSHIRATVRGTLTPAPPRHTHLRPGVPLRARRPSWAQSPRVSAFEAGEGLT